MLQGQVNASLDSRLDHSASSFGRDDAAVQDPTSAAGKLIQIQFNLSCNVLAAKLIGTK